MMDQILAENVAASLRREILNGKYPPGTPIKERDTARDLGISRTPMREAVRILAKEGLLVLRPARSAIVANPTFKEVSDAIDVLLALETLSVQQACKKATDADLEKVKAVQAKIAEEYDHLDELSLFELDMSFHMSIAEASHNAALFETYKSYLERLWRARFLSARKKRNRTRVVKQHTALLDAIITRDETTALKALHEHLGCLVVDIRPIIEEESSRADVE